ncbi:hypothetical protein DIPPA_56652 [Diplonema papillatum]|nr:hypothetical protein DIPPA_56652 [Diplonema papillatum]
MVGKTARITMICAMLGLVAVSLIPRFDGVALPHRETSDQILKQPVLWNETNDIPKTIHQCWKTEQLPSWATSNVETWKASAGFEHILWTDATMLEFVIDKYPQFLPLYNASRPVERADFFRYLVLFDQGGYYSDLDVSLAVPLHEWSARYPGVKFFTGLEVAAGNRPDWDRWWARKFQMVQWTLASVPGHPVLHRILLLIWQRWKQYGSRLFGNLSANVMESTGPGIWSDAVSGILRERGINLGTLPFDAAFVTENGVRAGEFLVLAKAGLGRTGSDGPGATATLVQHQFQGTWKTEEAFVPPMGFYHSDMKGGWKNLLASPGNTSIRQCGDRCLDTFSCKAYEVRHTKVGPCFLYSDLSSEFISRTDSFTFIHGGLAHDAYSRIAHPAFKEYDGMHSVLVACESQCESDIQCLAYGTSSKGGCTIHHEVITEATVPASMLVMKKDFPTPANYFRRRLGGYWLNAGSSRPAANPAECSALCDSDPGCIAFEIHTDDQHCYTFQELMYPFSPNWYCKTYLKLK